MNSSVALVVVDNRELPRECLIHSLASRDVGLNVIGFGSIDEWKQEAGDHPPMAALLFSVVGSEISEQKAEEIKDIVKEFTPVPVLLLADTEEPSQIVLALEHGVKAYIPSSVDVAVCISAVRLALVGGVFVPSSSIMAMRQYIVPERPPRPLSTMFTKRQSEVLQELRVGKANKIIAYELDMKESTVKVHIRNIMKKLKASNRTEVAFKLDKLFPEGVHRGLQ